MSLNFMQNVRVLHPQRGVEFSSEDFKNLLKEDFNMPISGGNTHLFLGCLDEVIGTIVKHRPINNDYVIFIPEREGVGLDGPNITPSFLAPIYESEVLETKYFQPK